MTIPSLLLESEALDSLDLFIDVDPSTVMYLLEECTERYIGAGGILLDPTVPNDTVYVVLRGSLEVRHAAPDGKVISTLGYGACAGEMSMIEGASPNAYVIALENCQLMCVKHETLWALINSSHAAARNLLMMLLHRVQADKRFMRESTVIMRQYHRRALTDPMTDLHNRYGMEKFFPRALARCQRDGVPAAQVVIDVDNFKDFNNRYGHLAGDAVLMAVADQIQTRFRPTDLMARYGGDEFTVLLPNTEIDRGLETAERVRKSVTVCQALEAEDVHVSVSMGLASMEADDTVESLFGRADEALYRAKNAGRNRVSL